MKVSFDKLLSNIYFQFNSRRYNEGGAVAKPAAATAVEGKKTQSIASLNPYMGTWTIKAKVATMGDIRTFRNAKAGGVFKSSTRPTLNLLLLRVSV